MLVDISNILNNFFLISITAGLFFFSSTIEKSIIQFSRAIGGKNVVGFIIFVFLLLIIATLPIFISGLVAKIIYKIIIGILILMFAYFKFKKDSS